jgi:hypothetical protein
VSASSVCVMLGIKIVLSQHRFLIVYLHLSNDLFLKCTVSTSTTDRLKSHLSNDLYLNCTVSTSTTDRLKSQLVMLYILMFFILIVLSLLRLLIV